ncbi:hypothetical protein AB0903_03525 [Streptomyces sp. NPDC048389]|uniref:hypothetical protein n=1 Tax=Streptomyces sp. NPDC048389 TaxID=3154622 RepID=UPI0034521A77
MTGRRGDALTMFAAGQRRLGQESATMCLADALALHRGATGPVRGTRPTVRRMFMEPVVDRTCSWGSAAENCPAATSWCPMACGW